MSPIVHVEIEEGRQAACAHPADLPMHPGDPCIVEVDRILEFGKVSKLHEADAPPLDEKRLGKVLRRATLQDHAKANENGIMSKIAMSTVSAKVEKVQLNMRLVRVRYSFDRSVLRVTFTAEERVEYGQLVQELATELKTRIEMHQIGVRDEAGMIGGMGPCGRKLCCCSWLHHFDSINVRMAKAQRVSLNPGAISGMCGRLKCCLKYEFETYRELGRQLPHDGTIVVGPDGKGQVIDKDILRQRVRVRLEDDRVMEYDVGEVRIDQHCKRACRKEDDEDPGAEWTESEPAGKAGTGHLRTDEP